MSDPCTKRKAQAAHGAAECFRAEQAIWDDLLNENFRKLREDLDEDQKTKLRDMQRAWIEYRNTTCQFYYDKIQGTMAVDMTAACLARASSISTIGLAAPSARILPTSAWASGTLFARSSA